MRRRAILRATGALAGALVVPGLANGASRDVRPAGTATAGVEEVARWRPTDHDERWGGWDPGTTIHDVTVVGDRAYCAYWEAGAWVLDVTEPRRPSVLGRAGHYSLAEFEALAGTDSDRRSAAGLEAPGNAHYVDATADGSLVGVGAEGWDARRTDARGPGGIALYDGRSLGSRQGSLDGAAPSVDRLARIAPPRAADETWAGTWVTAHNFALAGDRLYSSWYQGGVKIHDVSEPADPRLLAWWRDPARTRFWAARPLAGDAVLASSFEHDGTRDALYVFPDRAGRQPDPPSLGPGGTSQGPDPAERPPETGDPFEPLATLDLPGTTEVVVDDAGETAYVAVGNGFAVVDVSTPAEPTTLAVRRGLLSDHPEGPLGRVRDVAVDGGRLVVPGSGKQGSLNGFFVYDVSDPADPRQVGEFHGTPFGIHNADVADGHAYLTGNALPGNPVVVVDLSAPADPDPTPTPTSTPTGTNRTPTRTNRTPTGTTRTPTPTGTTPTPTPGATPTTPPDRTGPTTTGDPDSTSPRTGDPDSTPAGTGDPDSNPATGDGGSPTEGGSTPGFGVLAALGGVGLGACRYLRDGGD